MHISYKILLNMKILKINPYNPDIELIKKASNVLTKGGTIVYPTDTCYGIGADISNKRAFYKVYDIKKRPHNKPVSVIVKNYHDINELAVIKKEQEKYISKYLPGRVTLIFLTLNQDTFPFSSVGIRIPNYKTTEIISEIFNSPYITTSANISNYPPVYSIGEFIKQLSSNDLKPDLILDAGKLNQKELSTVIDLTGNKIKILRQGAVKIKEL